MILQGSQCSIAFTHACRLHTSAMVRKLYAAKPTSCPCPLVCAGAAVPLPTEEQMLEALVFKDGPSQSLYY